MQGLDGSADVIAHALKHSDHWKGSARDAIDTARVIALQVASQAGAPKPAPVGLDLEAMLTDAIEGMEDMIGYVSEYFQWKHSHQDYIDRAKANLEKVRRLRARHPQDQEGGAT